MAVGEMLKNFRDKGYLSTKQDDEKPEENVGPRSFKLTDDEVKELKGYAQGDGMEQECLVTGRIGEGGEFTVSSVKSPNGNPDEKGMADDVMSKMQMPPVMQQQTMPSPS